MTLIQKPVNRSSIPILKNGMLVHFSTWMSPEAYLYMVKEFQRLKEEEAIRLEKIESTKNWIFEKVMRNAEELNSVARLGLEITNLEEEE
jgi:hypothetical protein